MYKFTIENNTIFRDKIGRDGILIEREPILDKDTLLNALAQWTPTTAKKSIIHPIGIDLTGDKPKQYCLVNPLENCPECGRYKDDCEGLERCEVE